MRWFKHMTDADDNEKLSRLQDEFGLEGYGFWWRVVEIIAKRVNEENQTDLCYSAKSWARRIGVSTRKFKKLLSFCAELGLVSASHEKDMVTVNMPNILKYRDEYTTKKNRAKYAPDDVSGQCPDSRARALTDTDTDTDTEKENIKRKQTKEKVAPAKTETPPGPLSGGDGYAESAADVAISKTKERPQKTSKSKKSDKERFAAMIAEYTDNQTLRENLNAFAEMREKIRKPLTAHALELSFKQLDNLSGDNDDTKCSILEQSIQRSWQGLFPVKSSCPDTPHYALGFGPGMNGNTRPVARTQFQKMAQDKEDMAKFYFAVQQELKNGGRTDYSGATS